MVKVKSIDEIAKKWAEVTPGRAPYYEAGVRNPRNSWAAGAKNAKGAWAQGVQEAISDNRYEKGVTKAGDPKWQRKALELGTRRWPEGVRAAESDYRTNVAPYIDTISRIVLPDKKAKGDPGNIERVRKIADALHKKKLELLGGSAAGST